MTLQHIVLFSFPNPLSAEDEARLRAMVAAWPREIGLMTKCRLGTDITGARTRGYSHLLFTEFPDFETMTACGGRASAHRPHRYHAPRAGWI